MSTSSIEPVVIFNSLSVAVRVCSIAEPADLKLFLHKREMNKVGSSYVFNCKVGSIVSISKFLYSDWSLSDKVSD